MIVLVRDLGSMETAQAIRLGVVEHFRCTARAITQHGGQKFAVVMDNPGDWADDRPGIDAIKDFIAGYRKAVEHGNRHLIAEVRAHFKTYQGRLERATDVYTASRYTAWVDALQWVLMKMNASDEDTTNMQKGEGSNHAAN